MCTINMTFEVPESKHIDIEALKRQMNAFYHIIISTPSIIMPEKTEKKKYDISVFDSLSNDWNIDEEDLRKARKSDWTVEQGWKNAAFQRLHSLNYITAQQKVVERNITRM